MRLCSRFIERFSDAFLVARFLAPLPYPPCHNTTLQHDGLLSATATVTKEKIQGELPRMLSRWTLATSRIPTAKRGWRRVAQCRPTPVPSWVVGYALDTSFWLIAVTNVPYLFRSQMAKFEL